VGTIGKWTPMNPREAGHHSRIMSSACQHTEHLSLVAEFRRTAGGHMEPDGKSVVCGACGDRWHFRARVQLPDWLRYELINRGL
jgi:hypothetical protein